MAAEESSPLEALPDARFRLWSRGAGGAWGPSERALPDLDRPTRTAVVADFDRDGTADVLVGGLGTHRVELLRTTARTDRGWLRVRLEATGSAPSAWGATVEVTAGDVRRAQVLGGQVGFAAAPPRELCFGLGASDRASVRVLWPGRTEYEPFGELASGATVLLVEGAGAAQVVDETLRPFESALPDGVKIPLGVSPSGWTLRARDGGLVALDFQASATPMAVHLATGDLPLDGLREARDEAQRSGARLVAIALAPGGWTTAALDELEGAGAVELLQLDWADPEHLRELDPWLDLYSLELPTTLSFDLDGRLRSIDRHLARRASVPAND